VSSTRPRPSQRRTPFTEAVGAAIRSFRVERGHSQEGFASHAGFDRSYYGAIERGEFNISMGTLARLAEALETPPSQLFARAGM
jgi:transcriptional regulator with XRE-family HTH domain